jgi:hypothetical protein
LRRAGETGGNRISDRGCGYLAYETADPQDDWREGAVDEKREVGKKIDEKLIEICQSQEWNLKNYLISGLE